MNNSDCSFQCALLYICQWWVTLHCMLFSAVTAMRRTAYKLLPEVSAAHIYPLLDALALLGWSSLCTTSDWCSRRWIPSQWSTVRVLQFKLYPHSREKHSGRKRSKQVLEKGLLLEHDLRGQAWSSHHPAPLHPDSTHAGWRSFTSLQGVEEKKQGGSKQQHCSVPL